ncbi:MAG: hypothetical protein ACYCOO_01475 [Chitinophagaceae bacterium]
MAGAGVEGFGPEIRSFIEASNLKQIKSHYCMEIRQSKMKTDLEKDLAAMSEERYHLPG